MVDPFREYYQRQLEAVTGLPLRAVQRELTRLTAAGLLYRRSEGNRVYYQVDTDFALFPELRSLILKAAPPLEGFRASLAGNPAVRLAFLSGDGDRVLVVMRPGGARGTECSGRNSGGDRQS